MIVKVILGRETDGRNKDATIQRGEKEPVVEAPKPVETPTTPVITPQPSLSLPTTYKVSRGDTLNRIAAANGITVAQLKAWNNLKSDLILVGQSLVVKPTMLTNTVPVKTETTTTTTTTPSETTVVTTTTVKPSSYRVVAGDSLNKIAAAHGVTVNQLKEWNKLNSNLILVGQSLTVSKPTVTTAETVIQNTANKAEDLTTAVVRLVDYDVKLNGKTELIQHGLTSNSLLSNVVNRFGQRFVASKELVKNGVTYLELTQNGIVVEYTPKTAAVEVLRGKKVIYLDAGHGGSETGAYSFGVAEKDLNLNITKQLAERLTQQGYIVHQSRTTDKAIPLRDREDEPNRLMSDIYISVHHNAMPASRAGSMSGILSLYHDPSIDEEGYETMPHHIGTNIIPEGRRLAQALQRGMVNATGGRDLGARPQNLHVTRTTDMPATLVELGFQDNYA